MRVAPVKLSSFKRETWNRSAFARGASVRSDHTYLSRMWFKHIGRGSVRTYGIFLEAGELVGHFTILRQNGTCWFVDGLKLDSEHQHRWEEAMVSALALLGPGDYRYGWYLSIEEPRAEMLSALTGVKVHWIEDAVVQGVDFSNWENWPSYYRSISENSRRNAAKMDKQFQKIEMGKAFGISALRIIPAFVRFRASNYARKQLAGHWLTMLIRYFINAVFMPKMFCLEYFAADGRIAAVQLNQEFCELTYYQEGAYNPDISGAAWRLQIEVVKAAFERYPKGKYIMGYTAWPFDAENVEGLMRSRRAMRVREWKNQVVYFKYQSNPAIPDRETSAASGPSPAQTLHRARAENLTGGI